MGFVFFHERLREVALPRLAMTFGTGFGLFLLGELIVVGIVYLMYKLSHQQTSQVA